MKAIVFDNAGTILKRVSVLKNMSTKLLINETNTIDFINKNDESLILVFQTPTKELIQDNKNIIDYLRENKSLFEIGYSKKDFSKEEIIKALQNDKTRISDIKDSAIALIDKYDIEICSGSALIINMKKQKIEYAYTAGGIFFPDTLNIIKTLKSMNYDIFIASGDNKQSLATIANILNIPETNVYDTCNINCKKNVVSNLQEKYNQVIMVGNNTNDLQAIQQADVGILSLEQKEKLPESLINSADYIVDKLGDILKIVKKEN